LIYSVEVRACSSAAINHTWSMSKNYRTNEYRVLLDISPAPKKTFQFFVVFKLVFVDVTPKKERPTTWLERA